MNCELQWIQATPDLSPDHRHGDRGIRPAAWGKRRDRCRKLIISQIVEKDLPCTRGLAHVDQIPIWTIACHLTTHITRELFCCGPTERFALPWASKRCHDMKAFATRGLAKRQEPEFGKSVTHFLGTLDHSLERHIGCRIQIEDKPARQRRLARLVVPGMKFDAGALRNGRRSLDTINLHVRLAVT